ncbi:MAG: hypothetical protein WC002_07285 [Candidatus Muiribacteriota bacterium]
MELTETNLKWSYSFIKNNLKVSALAISVLVLFLFFASFWVKPGFIILLFIFVIFYFRELFFGIDYDLDRKNGELSIKNGFIYRKKHDIKKYRQIKNWKNGLFLATIGDNSFSDNLRGLKLFVSEPEKVKIKGILNGYILSE